MDPEGTKVMLVDQRFIAASNAVLMRGGTPEMEFWEQSSSEDTIFNWSLAW